MASTLHEQLKELYSTETSAQEVSVEGYRIDVQDDELLVEIQSSSLAALKPKVRHLLTHTNYQVWIVKPLPARKFLIKRQRSGGKILSSRYSPRRATVFDAFEELVHLANEFPHPQLTIELLLIEQEEHRVVGSRRVTGRKGYRVEDRCLREVMDRVVLQTVEDLRELLPTTLAEEFTTSDLAQALQIPRWLAQKIAYCCRKAGLFVQEGKRAHSLLYSLIESS